MADAVAKPIKMAIYTKTKVIRITEEQHKTLVKMKSYNVDVGRFIRQAIKEKIDKEYQYLKPKEEIDSFMLSLNKVINKNYETTL